ncbi:DUF6430 domain-containing protein [Bacillus thuringiensis]|uniref:macro domain-containing protein n=2 Tax=Bacillus thuringiensis TaxID=1428 RepID=UPI000A3A506C|nr:macro domain-containing protein [Bacillus thuringiensis]MED2148100.1 DUF6430 domain-containing protein [Bacillus thuringiensis]MED2174831.1 DUF6430 domain-containing protein [Bacillus thuringiensis]MED2476452.1 DUF6430 domain-containing protein [Bacillus thuringiensis]MED2648611.1 DUF6430 domain-containing protein [Bacillus thuringiensis]MED3502497.1 DUF6430 domain-containing protein [Bacillus thuringiensis]
MRLNYKLLVKNLIYVLGFSATVISFFLTIYNPFSDETLKFRVLLIVLFMLINIGIAVAISWPKNKIKIRINNKIKLNVFFGDIFKQKDNIVVIPVNEYFDTLVDEKVISSKTLHGLFIKNIFGGDVNSLERSLTSELSHYKESEMNTSRKNGKFQKYKIGTTVNIEKDGISYFLFAFSRFDDANKAECFNVDYQIALKDLLNYIHENSQGKEINIPLIGGGQSGVNLTKQKLLEYLIFSIQIHENLTVSGDINIVLHQNLKEDIDLNKIKSLFMVSD